MSSLNPTLKAEFSCYLHEIFMSCSLCPLHGYCHLWETFYLHSCRKPLTFSTFVIAFKDGCLAIVFWSTKQFIWTASSLEIDKLQKTFGKRKKKSVMEKESCFLWYWFSKMPDKAFLNDLWKINRFPTPSSAEYEH